MLGSKENIYRICESEGWFLPKFSSRAITVDYLFKVLNAQVFRCQKADICHPPNEKRIWSNIDLVAYLDQRVAPLPLGISVANLSERLWLLTVAYTFDPHLEIFSGIQQSDQIVSIPLRLLDQYKFFDPLLKQSKKPVLKKTSEQKVQEERDILEKRRFRKERRCLYLNNQARKLGAEISDIDAELDLNRPN